MNVAQSAKGQAVTLRGRARPAGGQQGSEVMIAMERQLRESGAFDSIQRSSEAPDSRGYQEFTLNATAVRPTYVVKFPEAQDFATKSMRVRRYGPPPADVDAVASGLNPKDIEAAKDAGETGASDSHEAPAAHASDAAHGATSSDSEKSAVSEKSAAGKATRATASATPKTSEPNAPRAETTNTTIADAKTADAPADDAKSGDAKGDDSKAAARAARSSGSGRGALATRSKPGGSAEPDPPPAPLSANEINKMSKEEARAALGPVSNARKRADLSDEVQARLKEEFNLLIERSKRD